MKAILLLPFLFGGLLARFLRATPKNVADANKRDNNPPLPSSRFFIPVSHSHHDVQGTDPVLKSRNFLYAAFRQTLSTAESLCCNIHSILNAQSP
jgi:hypothetical protein